MNMYSNFQIADDCRIPFKDESSTEMQVVQIPYSCNICERTFTELHTLQRHVRVHRVYATKKRIYTCSLCKKCFSRPEHLSSHKSRAHEVKQRSFECTSCSKAFYKLKQLKVHERIHSGEKPFFCTFCDKSFGYANVLKLHMETHFDDVSYPCKFCKSIYRSKRALKHHMQKHPSPEISDFCEISAKISQKLPNLKESKEKNIHCIGLIAEKSSTTASTTSQDKGQPITWEFPESNMSFGLGQSQNVFYKNAKIESTNTNTAFQDTSTIYYSQENSDSGQSSNSFPTYSISLMELVDSFTDDLNFDDFLKSSST